MKIVVLDGYALNPGDLSWDKIKKLGELEIYDRTPENKILERAQGADILLTNKTPIKRKTIEALPKLKYVGILATGYNVVDIETAAENDVIVTNAPDYSTNAVAQFTLALLLEAALHVGEHNRAVKEKQWSKSEDFCFWNYPLIELQNRILGIIGFGSIGQRTAELALAFGMKVVVYDHSPERKISDPEILTDNLEFTSLTALYDQSDVISLHCPLTKETAGMINQKSIAQMKKNVIIINTARGGLIIEEDLTAALESTKVQFAAIDVLTAEPPSPSNQLLNSKNTIITPHIAWATKESRQCLMDIVYENIESFINGNITNQVN
jgi:glycerate dehydrogenase